MPALTNAAARTALGAACFLLASCGNGADAPESRPAGTGADRSAVTEDPQPRATAMSDQGPAADFFCDLVRESRPAWNEASCALEADGDTLEIGIFGETRAEATVLEAGDTYTFDLDSGLRRLVRDDAGYLENASGLFLAAGGDGPLCARMSYLAPDPTADSVFLRRPGMESIVVPLPRTVDSAGEHTVPASVFSVSDGEAFALLPREYRTVVQTLTLVPCEG